MKKGLKWLIPLSFAGALIITPHMAHASEENNVWHATPAEDMQVDTSNPNYEVKWGDTLFNLGIRTGVSVDDLFQMNQDKITNVDDIQAHSTLTIPTGYQYKNKGENIDKSKDNQDKLSYRSEILTHKNVSHMKKDVKYFTSDGKHYVLNGKCYNDKGKPLADMTVNEIKKLPLQNGIYEAEPVK